MSGEIGVAVTSDGVEYSEDLDATGEGCVANGGPFTTDSVEYSEG